MNEGLVAPSWSDSGDVPVGEVTYTEYTLSPNVAVCAYNGHGWEDELAHAVFAAAEKFGLARAALSLLEPKPSDPNAKPALSALSKVAGESYRGLGWCEE